MMEPLIAALVGASLPSLLRIWHAGWPRDGWGPVLLILMLQITIAMALVWLMEPSERLQAAAIGYAAPEVAVRALAGPPRSAAAPEARMRNSGDQPQTDQLRPSSPAGSRGKQTTEVATRGGPPAERTLTQRLRNWAGQ